MKVSSMPKLNSGIIIRKENAFGIVFDAIKNLEKMFNEIGIDILNLCDGEHDINQIVDEIEKLYNADREIIEKDVLEFLKEQTENGILEENNKK